MEKKILSGIFALALLITAGYGVNKSVNSNADLSLLALSNVEALGQTSGEDVVITCGQYEGRCWAGFPTPSGLHFNCYFTGLQRDYCVWNPFGI
jgi:hypothetical protein